MLSYMGWMRMKVNSYSQTLFINLIIALKYESEVEYHYITAADLSWQAVNIVSVYMYALK